MIVHPEKPYSELPNLPPDLEFLEDRELTRLLIEAHRALAELKGSCKTLPNPEVLLNAVILHEGKDSSEIENLVTTQDELFRAAAIPAAAEMTAQTREVVRYREAMAVGLGELSKNGLLTTNTWVRIVQTLKGNDAGIRSGQVVIANPASGKVIYTPPEGERLIRDKLSALDHFLHEDSDLDPLVKMALFHYQFEAIHPFYDGNGRTGRIANILYLIRQGLLDLPVLYLSSFVLKYKTEYYLRIRRVTEESDWTGWVRYLLQAVSVTARATLSLVEDIGDLIDRVAEDARSGMTTGYSLELVHSLFHQPYCKILHLVDAGIASRVTASKYLHDLADLGILDIRQVHRDKYFVNHRLLGLLSNFGQSV